MRGEIAEFNGAKLIVAARQGLSPWGLVQCGDSDHGDLA